MADLTEAEQTALDNALEFQSSTSSGNSRSKTNQDPEKILKAIQLKQRMASPSKTKKVRFV
jgi:hypothetical protein